MRCSELICGFWMVIREAAYERRGERRGAERRGGERRGGRGESVVLLCFITAAATREAIFHLNCASGSMING